ncbi:MAG TPA: UDP-N-acetylmuramoyl-tripeptide--D-alanyl-D-alanine ligase [Burkholderiaceae bacterium]|nr:UDP-N-acetylmuramoyl-tripeptide--D-alanyl-D-alanine ligase [Burkholderiaceae bacterium]
MSSPMMTLGDAHALLAAAMADVRLVGDASVAIERVHSDTRSLRAGDLFVALRGERFDANDFLGQARDAGAAAALAERGLAESGLPGLLVPDSRAALGALAGAWRRRFDLPLIAVTGSNGKTTVTQMIASILRAWVGAGAFATEGNFNNDIGVPLTLLRLRRDDAVRHRAAVVEIGMNHPGEIAPLAALAAPTVALVNNAQREHLEFMADVKSVAIENGAVLGALAADGVAVFPADEPYTPLWREIAGARRVLTFALDADADIRGHCDWRADHWAVTLVAPSGTCDVRLAVAGRHNVKNALAAAACALGAGCPLAAVRAGLEAFTPVKGRSQVRRIAFRGRDATLIDDSYNANPDSVRAAIDVLAALDAPRWLVLGDMGEVGSQGPALHAEVGAYARERGIEQMWAAGEASAAAAEAHGAARHFENAAALVAALVDAPAAAAIVVKGSRFMKMEQVVAALATRQAEAVEGASHAA